MIFVLKTNPALYTWRIKKLLHEIWLIFLCSFSFDLLQGTAKPQSRRGKAIVLKNVPMEISWFFMFYLINVGHILKVWDFWKRYFTAANDWKQTKKKRLWNSTSNKGQNKTVHQIGLINLSWSQRNYAVLVPFLNSVAV